MTNANLKELLKACSIQGFSNIHRSETLKAKLIWSIIMISSAAACSYYISKCILDFMNFEYVTSVKTVFDPVSQFPSVSICSVQEKKFDFTVLDLSFNLNKLNKWTKHFVYFNDTVYGRCYRFNGGKNFSGHTAKIKTSTSGGQNFGLTMDLFINNQENYDFGRFNIYIHNHTEIPQSISNKGIFITTGYFNHFIFKRAFEQKLEEPYNNCYRNINSFPYNKTIINIIENSNHYYSEEECINICRNLKYMETDYCNCTLNVLEDLLFSKCLKTSNPILSNCTSTFLEEFQKLNPYSVCSQYCPAECDSIDYDINHISESILTSGKINKGFPYPDFKTYENVSKRFFSIYVYYKDLKYTLITQQPKMQIFDLISNIGGLFGLFLGMGLLSFVELIEIIIELVFVMHQKYVSVVSNFSDKIVN